MAAISDSAAEENKMTTQSNSDDSSTRSLPVPVSTHQLDLEKTASKATQRTNRSRRSDRVATTAQDWDGEDDPDNPLNWPTMMKIYHTLIPALQCFTMYERPHLIPQTLLTLYSTFGSSVYTPSMVNPVETA